MSGKPRAALMAFALLLAISGTARAQPVVVLDPGHGGANPGAPGSVPGILEKDVTLAIAHRVAARLSARGITVLLTRDGDHNLSLRLRGARANAAGADVFVSIHCNATPAHDARGFETYLLSAAAASVKARALRGVAGDGHPGMSPAVAQTLRDVERGLAITGAARLAATIQAHLARVRGHALDRGVRRGAMHVLLGANMPAVLVEVGFIDHPSEGRALADPAIQRRIGDALAAAIADHLAANRVVLADASSRP